MVVSTRLVKMQTDTVFQASRHQNCHDDTYQLLLDSDHNIKIQHLIDNEQEEFIWTKVEFVLELCCKGSTVGDKIKARITTSNIESCVDDIALQCSLYRRLFNKTELINFFNSTINGSKV